MSDNTREPATEIAGAISEGISRSFTFLRRELILRGILFALFGILIICRPVQVMTAVTVAVGVLLLIEGGFMLGAALSSRSRGRTVSIVTAVLFLLLGIFSVAAPLKTNLFWIVVIGLWQIFSAVQLLFFAGAVHRGALVSGIVSLVAGILLVTLPICGMLAFGWLLGIILLIGGVSAIVFGIKLGKATTI